MKKALLVGALFLTACGGTKTVYVINTDAPDTTVKQTTTTDAPIAIAPAPAPVYTTEDEFIFDIETSYGPILIDDATVIEVGYATCTFLRGGGTSAGLLMAMNGAIGNGVEQEFVVAVVASAVVNFCPDQAWKVQA